MAKVKQPKVDSVAKAPSVSRSAARVPVTSAPSAKSASATASPIAPVPARVRSPVVPEARSKTGGQAAGKHPPVASRKRDVPTVPSSAIRVVPRTAKKVLKKGGAKPRTAAPASRAPRGRKGAAVVSTRAGAGAPSRKAKALKARGLQSRSPKGAARNGSEKGRKHLAQTEPVRVVQIKQLDPFSRCGPRTSVVHLYRVEERLDGESSVHLVFFDRHGWYCEHGKTCRAVDDLRRNGKQLGLTF